MAMIEVDDHTFRSLELAARMANTTAGRVIARLVEESIRPLSGSPGAGDGQAAQRQLPIFADYESHRTHATYDLDTARIEITSGPLKGSSYKSPSGAARDVVTHYKPTSSPNRNGWRFWIIDDGSGRLLEVVRPLRR